MAGKSSGRTVDPTLTNEVLTTANQENNGDLANRIGILQLVFDHFGIISF